MIVYVNFRRVKRRREPTGMDMAVSIDVQDHAEHVSHNCLTQRLITVIFLQQFVWSNVPCSRTFREMVQNLTLKNMYKIDLRLLASQRRGGAQVSHAGVQWRGTGARGGFRGNIGEIRHAGHERPGGVQVRHARGTATQRLFDSCVGRGISWTVYGNTTRRDWGGVESVCSRVPCAPVPDDDLSSSHVLKRMLLSDLYAHSLYREKDRRRRGAGFLIR